MRSGVTIKRHKKSNEELARKGIFLNRFDGGGTLKRQKNAEANSFGDLQSPSKKYKSISKKLSIFEEQESTASQFSFEQTGYEMDSWGKSVD